MSGDAADFKSLKKDIKHRMEQAVEVLKKEFAGLRTGRAHTSLLDPVVVEAYGSTMPLNQVANVSVPRAADAAGLCVGSIHDQGR